MIIDYNRLFDSEIVIYFKILIGVLRRLAVLFVVAEIWSISRLDLLEVVEVAEVVGVGEKDGGCGVVGAGGDPVEDEEDRHDDVHETKLVAPLSPLALPHDEDDFDVGEDHDGAGDEEGADDGHNQGVR